jgi:hypothetical protein
MLLLAPVAVRGEGSLATSCPGYPAHLRAARTALGRGDRPTALAELRNAQAVLESCLREQAAGRSLLAHQPTSIHEG